MNQQWQDYHTSLVRQLKQLCTNLPRLVIPEPGDQLIVEIDASDKYWGGVLKGLRLERMITESMSVDMPMAVLNQLKLITIVMRRSF